jgi:hypothetical protein
MGGAHITHERDGTRVQSFGKPQEIRLVERSKLSWEDNKRMVRREIGWKGVDWIHVAEDTELGGQS